MTATEVQGNFNSLSPGGFVFLGIAGFLVNAFFCVIGWWVLSRKPFNAEIRLLAWFFFAINGMLPTTAMLSETLVGWGDWMTILGALPATTYSRTLVMLLGFVGLVIMVRLSGAELAKIIPPGEPHQRTIEARHIVLIGAITSVILALGGSITNLVGITRGIILALGAGLIPFIPMIFSTRFVPRISSENMSSSATVRWPWFVAAVVLTGILWFIVGPGIVLSGFGS